MSETALMQHLVAIKSGNNFGIIGGEPSWNKLPCVLSVVSALSLPNSPLIAGAIGATTVTLGPVTVLNPLEEIRLCRNYAAHKGEPALRLVSQYSTPFQGYETHIFSRRLGVPTFSLWVEALQAIAVAAAQ